MENTNYKFINSRKSQNMSTFVLFCVAVFVLSSVYLTIPLLSIFQSEFSVTLSQSALTGSIFSIFFAIGCLIFGLISEKYGLKRVMIYGLIILSVITLLIGLSNNFSQLLILRALQGVAAASFSPVALIYIGIVFPPERRVTAIGIISTGFLMAGIIGQLISSFIVLIWSWRTVFYFFGIIYGVITLVLATLPKDKTNKDIALKTIIMKISTPFHQKEIVLLYGISLTILLSFVGMYTALDEYLTLHFGLTDQQIFQVRAAGIIGISLAPFSKTFTNKLGMNRVLMLGLALSIISLVLLFFSMNFIFTIILSVIFVAGIALLIPALISLVGNYGESNKGIITTIYTCLIFIGAGLGPMIAAFVMKYSQPANVFIILSFLLSIALFFSICISILEKRHDSGI
ncbi:MFS transporter [Oceanobacillus sp. CF4.6]|uniref:MFS transporter n=1 Tax=Oceanobacillus sp. CF4.6 TaxID=3373080 RepID=UPI003EE473FC